MKSVKYFFAFIIILLPAHPLLAQDSLLNAPVTTMAKKKTTLTIGATYLPRLHFYGRTDSLKSNATAPNALLQFGNGIYLSSTIILINNVQIPMQYAATVAGAGYRFGKSKGLAGSVYGDLFFYANKNLVQSSQKGQVGYNLSYLNPVININNNSSVVFSGNNDFFTNLGVDCRFKFEAGKSVFVLIPTFTANAGTQNFTSTYFKTRSLNGLPIPPEQVTETSKKFNILSYELSMPMVFVRNRLVLSLTPGYVIPQSVIKVQGRADLSENAKNLFYGNVGVYFIIGKK